MVNDRIAFKEYTNISENLKAESQSDEYIYPNDKLPTIKKPKRIFLAMFNIVLVNDYNNKKDDKSTLLQDESNFGNEKNEIILTSFSGPIDDSNIHKVSNLINTSINENLISIIFDFEKLTYINCRGLNAILSFANQPNLNSVKFFFIKTPDNIYNLLKLVGFHKIFNFHLTLTDVLNEFHLSPNYKYEITELARYLTSYQCTNCNQIFSISKTANEICPNC